MGEPRESVTLLAGTFRYGIRKMANFRGNPENAGFKKDVKNNRPEEVAMD